MRYKELRHSLITLPYIHALSVQALGRPHIGLSKALKDGGSTPCTEGCRRDCTKILGMQSVQKRARKVCTDE